MSGTIDTPEPRVRSNRRVVVSPDKGKSEPVPCATGGVRVYDEWRCIVRETSTPQTCEENLQYIKENATSSQ